MLLGAKGLVTFVAFAAVIYFAFLLHRARIDGSSFLLFGCISLLAGYAIGLTFWTFGFVSMWAGVILESAGAGAAAYGFARITRATISNSASKLL
jgi:hypothetical protein